MRDQFFVLQFKRESAVEVLVSLVPEAAARKTLLKRVSAIASAGGPVTASERGRLARLSQVLAAPIEKTAAHATPGRPSSARATTRSGAVLH